MATGDWSSDVCSSDLGFFSYRSEDRTFLCYICVVFVSCHVRSVFFLSLSHFYHVNGILCYFCYVNGMLYTVTFMPCNIISLSCSCHARRDLPGQPAARLERTRRQLLQYVRHLLPLCHRHPGRGEHLWRPEGKITLTLKVSGKLHHLTLDSTSVICILGQKRDILKVFMTFTFSHLADAPIQSDGQ